MIATCNRRACEDMILGLDMDDKELIEMVDKHPSDILNLQGVNIFLIKVGNDEAGFFATSKEGDFAQTPLFLKKEYRGKGMGKSLISLAEKEVVAQGCRYAVHRIREKNEPMLRLSKRCGYKEVVHDGDYIVLLKEVG